MPKAKDVANYFISLSVPSTPMAITPLKLQKLVYYAQGWYMAFNGEPLFQEDIKAWDHGPVVPELYYEYKYLGYLTIHPKPFEKRVNGKQIFTKSQLDILDAVWEAYGEYDGKYLEELTHQEDPWLCTDKNVTIDKSTIRKYFQTLVN